MHEARFIADLFGHPCEKGDDVMLGDRLDGINRGNVDRRVGRPPRPQRICRRFRHHTNSASASVACASISNQILKRFSGSQMATMSGRA
jgi:hypothetical protein